MLRCCFLILFSALFCAAANSNHQEEENQRLDDIAQTADYGVDVSFPIHHLEVSDNYAWLPHNLDSSLPVPGK
jgi:hypothetical protein